MRHMSRVTSHAIKRTRTRSKIPLWRAWGASVFVTLRRDKGGRGWICKLSDLPLPSAAMINNKKQANNFLIFYFSGT